MSEQIMVATETTTTATTESPPPIIYQRKTRKISKRPLMPCLTCGKLGIQYLHNKNGQRHMFTIHSNENPVAIVNGKPRYRRCESKGRIYDTLEELIKSDPNVIKQPKVKKIKSRPRIKARQKLKITKKGFNCPKCNHRGRLNIADSKAGTFYVTHEKIEGKFYGTKKSTKRPRYIRHYLDVGRQTEKATRSYKRK